MKSFKLWIAQKAVTFYFKTGLYFAWSRFQWLFQRTRIPLDKLDDMSKITTLLQEFEYGNDPWWQLWDAMYHPLYLNARLVNKIPITIDCDDYALLAAEALKQFISKENILILSVGWIDRDNKYQGHNVCVFKTERQILGKPTYTWISNWYNKQFRSNYYSIKTIVNCIIADGTLIDYALFTPDLKKLVDFKTSLD
jgi:hypothetical protein